MNATTTAPASTSKDRRIERAVHRALEQAAVGNVPVLLRQHDRTYETAQVWSIGSRTTGGSVYVVETSASAQGVETRCTCAAGQEDRICWHRASVRLAIFGDIDHTDGRRPVEHLASLGNADRFGHAAD